MVGKPQPNSPFLRDLVGYLIGGLAGAFASGWIIVSIYPLPAVPNPRDHTGEALVFISSLAFFCGGFIGRRAFTPLSYVDILRPTLKSAAVGIVFCLMTGLSTKESVTSLLFFGAGLVASGLIALLFSRVFPPAQKREAMEHGGIASRR
ncbi:MAG: hypothetical protein ACJASX_004341 [Limisphaerales bacterium]|jgi:hypothetical protein